MNGNDGLGESAERISLWKLDQLMAGELPEREAEALRAAVSRSPEALAYLERNGSLQIRLDPESSPFRGERGRGREQGPVPGPGRSARIPGVLFFVEPGPGTGPCDGFRNGARNSGVDLARAAGSFPYSRIPATG